ncbi:MAG TPA: hypothetical protein VN213_04435 [Solirubrobacteraceae bacterium]|nr:hypothetical protein [Solirubrobacteraceae bacterium]
MNEDIVTLRSVSSEGDTLELEMPAWALGAIRRGQVVVYRGDDANEWACVGDPSCGPATRRLPLDEREWGLLEGA